jgi:hypothetical protein
MSTDRLENCDAALVALAEHRPALAWRRLIADTETPVGAALKLIEPGRGDFLLESVSIPTWYSAQSATAARSTAIGTPIAQLLRRSQAMRSTNCVRWWKAATSTCPQRCRQRWLV